MKRNDLKYIYLASPWSPMGGGMYKIADYLIQSQAEGLGAANLRPLESRGAGSAVFSPVFLALALIKILMGRLSGQLVGVHVNMAERLSLLRKGIIVLFAKSMGVPVVLHLHAAQLHHGYHAVPSLLQRLIRLVFLHADSVIVLGTQAQQFIVEEMGVPAQRVDLVTNGVPISSEPRRTFNANEPFNVLFLGNLSERKGVSDLLKALATPGLMARQGKWLARFAGGGDVAHYQALADALGIADRVEWLGWADQALATKLVANADVVILPSYDEGLPLTILEALAKGVAVIATPVGEIPTVLTPDVDALLVNPGDVSAIAQALLRLMDEPALRVKLEQAGFEVYRQKFSMDVFFKAIAHIHQQQFGCCATLRQPGSASL